MGWIGIPWLKPCSFRGPGGGLCELALGTGSRNHRAIAQAIQGNYKLNVDVWSGGKNSRVHTEGL